MKKLKTDKDGMVTAYGLRIYKRLAAFAYKI